VKVIFALVMPAALAAGLAIWSSSVVGRSPPTPELSRGTVLWADRFFSSSDGLAEWLNARGRSYRVWAEWHPKAAARQRAAAKTAPPNE
jgi:hypothetical protein